MRYLFYLNGAVLALGSVLSLVLGVVCLLYWIYLDREPQLADEMRLLIITTAIFTWIAGSALVAVLGQRRQQPWHWAGLLAWMAGFALIGLIFAP